MYQFNDTIFGNGGDDTIDSGLGDIPLTAGRSMNTFALTDALIMTLHRRRKAAETTRRRDFDSNRCG